MEDFGLFWIIVFAVGLVFIVSRIISPRSKRDEFSETVLESRSDSLPNYEHDPLFDDKETSAMSSQSDSSITAVFILPKKHNGFGGRVLQSALMGESFIHGKQKIYHKHIDDDPQKATICSVASITEPGYFNLDALHKTQYTGIVIFTVTSKQSDPVAAFDTTIKSAQRLAAALNGQLCDSARSNLTSQTIAHMRESISEAHRPTLAQRS